MYRNGVSEGQYDTVLQEELPTIRKACEKIYPATSTKNEIPRISIVVVGKRHNTRFHPTKEADADRSSNPQNGTVVDRGVTEASKSPAKKGYDCCRRSPPPLQSSLNGTNLALSLSGVLRQYHWPFDVHRKLGLLPPSPYSHQRNIAPSPLLCDSRRDIPTASTPGSNGPPEHL